jgi:hypothetical protein
MNNLTYSYLPMKKKKKTNLIKPFVSITIPPLLPLKIIIKTEHILIHSKNPKTKTLSKSDLTEEENSK